MVLVDTSVWIHALTGKAPFVAALDDLLDCGEVVGHELVYGELLIGDRGGRPILLESYDHLLRVAMVPHAEVVQMVRARKLNGRGIGWIDAHLLAAAMAGAATLWTANPRLAGLAGELGVEHVVS